MDERSMRTTVPIDRRIEKAIVCLKKGAHLLKCGRRGKPKFRSFRLTTDEKALIWYSGEKERRLMLNNVSKFVLGQKTVNFLRQPHPGKELQSFSLIYQNDERSLDLICKDKEQAESWVLGLTALVYSYHRYNHCGNSDYGSVKGQIGNSCGASPIAYIQRKHNLGLLDDPVRLSEVCNLYTFNDWPILEKEVPNKLKVSSGIVSYSRQKSLSRIQSATDKLLPSSPQTVSNRFLDSKESDVIKKQRILRTPKFTQFKNQSPSEDVNDTQEIFMWGEGIGAILGQATNDLGLPCLKLDALLPEIVESAVTLDVLGISCGERHAALVTTKGAVFCWGQENNGKLGHKSNMNVPKPKVVESLADIFVQSVACGSQHTCAVSSSGELYAWGDCSHGIRHPGDQRSRSQWLPHRICGPLDGITVCKVACGEWHTAVISNLGQLFTFGDGTFGVLGHGNLLSCFQPKQVELLKGLKVKSVACGSWHTAAVAETMLSRASNNARAGKVFTWGDNDKGKLGHADMESKLLPTCVESLVDFDFVQVSCGRMFTAALTVTGIVFTMGSSTFGQLGNPLPKGCSVATVEGLLKSEFVKEISTGSFHVAALTTKGKVYTWGKGSNGRLGLGDTKDRNSPALVDALEDRHVRSIACGSSFTAAVCSHRSICFREESICSGCKMSFGLTKKKHNCYNCGNIFCHSCSRTKVLNASLAPNKSKKYRVCDTCYAQLQKSMDSKLKGIVQSPRLALVTLRMNMDEVMFAGRKIFSPFSPKFCNKMQSDRVKIVTNKESAESSRNVLESLPITQRWGQVSCPWKVSSHDRIGFKVKGSLSDLSNASKQHQQNISSLPPSSTVRLTKQSNEAENIFSEELQHLYTQAKILQKHCQNKDQKIQLCKQRVEETWSLARDEAAKFKAAKHFIRVLTKQLNVISEGISERKLMTNVKSILEDTALDLQKTEESNFTNQKPAEVHGTSVNGSSETISDAAVSHLEMNRSENSAVPGGTDTRELSILNLSKDEWMEHEPGVYVTFSTSPSGQKVLKRVKFSRKHFNEEEAGRWWKENQRRIHLKYDIQ